jgi:syntaxin 7
MSFLDVEAGGLPSARRQQDPSQALAAAVFQINTAVSSFKRLSNSLGTPKDTPALREKLYACLHRFPFFGIASSRNLIS